MWTTLRDTFRHENGTVGAINDLMISSNSAAFLGELNSLHERQSNDTAAELRRTLLFCAKAETTATEPADLRFICASTQGRLPRGSFPCFQGEFGSWNPFSCWVSACRALRSADRARSSPLRLTLGRQRGVSAVRAEGISPQGGQGKGDSKADCSGGPRAAAKQHKRQIGGRFSGTMCYNVSADQRLCKGRGETGGKGSLGGKTGEKQGLFQ